MNLQIVEKFIEFGDTVNEISNFIENSNNYNEYPTEGVLNSYCMSFEFFDYQKISSALQKCMERNDKDLKWVLGFLDEVQEIIVPNILLLTIISQRNSVLAEKLIYENYANIPEEKDLLILKKEMPEIVSALLTENVDSGEITYSPLVLDLMEISNLWQEREYLRNDLNDVKDLSKEKLKVVKF